MEPIYNSYVYIRLTVTTEKSEDIKSIKKFVERLRKNCKDHKALSKYSITDDKDICGPILSHIFGMIESSDYEHVKDRLRTRANNTLNTPTIDISIDLSLTGSRLADSLLSNGSIYRLKDEAATTFNCTVIGAELSVRKFLSTNVGMYRDLPKVIRSKIEVYN